MRDQSPIIGDLLEEYREHVLPSRGRLRAILWFVRQLASLVKPWVWGCVLGLTLGGGNLIGTMLAPLAEDTPLLMLTLISTVLGSLTLIGAAAARQRHRLSDGILAGIVAALISMSIMHTANYIRVTMFLDVLQERSDWVGLMQRFRASGASDLRAFVKAEYLSGTVQDVAIAAAVGAVTGALGGFGALRRRRPAPARA